MDKNKRIFQGNNSQDTKRLEKLPAPPPWREFENKQNRQERGVTYRASEQEIDVVNAALYLRRPLLITGRPGTGKSSLAYAIAHELGLDEVLIWPITSKSVLQHGLYTYDAIGRLQEASRRKETKDDVTQSEATGDIGRFIRLGPIGTAFLKSTPRRPCIILIDEIDKSDIDLPNDLLHLFEEGEFEIPELARLSRDNQKAHPVEVFAHGSQEKILIPVNGIIRCLAFPLIIMTSNGEREFPPAFLRRCLRLHLEPPNSAKLAEIVAAHLDVNLNAPDVKNLIEVFLDMRDVRHKEVATDQLLNAIHLLIQGVNLPNESILRDAIFKALAE
jgi:MoxR-like ATPase